MTFGSVRWGRAGAFGISSRRSWRERSPVLRDLLGGALLLAASLALWTVTWAAVAGPLRPADAVRAEAAALAERS